MKYLKHIVAMILAGALASVLLTGCCNSFSLQYENAYLDMVNLRREAGQEELTNDPILHRYTKQLMDNIVDWETGEIKENGTRINIVIVRDGKSYSESISIPCKMQDGKYYAIELTPENLQTLLQNNELGYENTAYARYTGVGIHVETRYGKTYYAIGLRQ